jgi:hypothetical protein
MRTKSRCLSPLLVQLGFFFLLMSPSAFAEAFQVDRWGVWDARFPGRKEAENFAIMQYPIVLSSRPDLRRVDIFFEYRGDLPMKAPRGGKPPVTAVFNGKEITPELRFRTAGTTEWVRVTLRLPDRDMKYAEKGAPNHLKLTLNGGDGTTVVKELTIPGLTLPKSDQLILDGKTLNINEFNYSMAVKLPPTRGKFTRNIPTMGEVGFGVQFSGKLAYYPFAKKKSSDLNGGSEIYAPNNKKYAVKIGSKSSAKWTGGEWTYDEWKVYIAFSQTIELWKLSFFGALPPETKKVVEGIPFVGQDLRKGLEGFKATLEAEPTLTGAASLGVLPQDPLVKSWTLSGEMDLRLSINMTLEITALGKFGAKALLGGKVELGLQSAEPHFQTFKGQVYVGADLYFACFESNVRFVLLDFNLSPAPKSSLPRSGGLQSLGVEQSGFSIMEVPKEDEVFPIQGLSQAGSGAMPPTQEMVDLTRRFQQISGPAMPRAAVATLGETPDEHVMANSATLPIVNNVTPLVWPSMAASDDKQMVIFGVDTREEGKTPENPVQFSKLMWTLCDANGNWSAPQPMPAGNGAAQMMSSVAFDGGNSFLAVWQQLRDPKFQGTDPGSWMNENEIVSARFDAGTKSWALQPVSKPVAGTGDFSPIVSMNASMPGKAVPALAVWLNGRIPNFGTTGQRPSGPEEVAFHWSRYKDGQWRTPDFSSAEGKKLAIKAPKGLLSFDVAAINNGDLLGGVLAYSFVAEDGTTKLAIRYFHEQFPYDSSQPESEPIWGPEVIVSGTGVNQDPVVKMRQVNSGFLVWNQDGKIVSTELRLGVDRSTFAKPTVIRPASTGTEFYNIQALAFKAGAWSGGKVKDQAIAWNEQSDDGPSIMLAVFDNSTSTWSEPIALTPGDALETLYDLKSDRLGNLMPLYVHTEISYETVETENERGEKVKVESAPVPQDESVRVAKVTPTRVVGFAQGGLSTVADDFMGGTTAKLTANVTNYGMLGVKPVTVNFYQGDPANGGKLLGHTDTKTIPGAATVQATFEWKMPEDVWDKDDAATEIYAVLGFAQPNHDTKILGDRARLNLEQIRLAATAKAQTLLADGSFTVEVGVENSGFPYAEPFPVVVYDYAGVHEIARVMMPRVGAGAFERVAVEMPAGSAGTAPEGKHFLVKIDPENTLKLPGNPKVETKVHVAPLK